MAATYLKSINEQFVGSGDCEEFSEELHGSTSIKNVVPQTFQKASAKSTSSEVDECHDHVKTFWSRKDILSLISAYKEKKKLFESSTIRNEKVWKQISLSVGNHTSEQCKNKFKYLKRKYIEKKENKIKTGAERIKFEYFEDMDEILGKNPQITPVILASSVCNENNIPEGEILEEEEEKKTNMAINSENILKDNGKKKTKVTTTALVLKEVRDLKDQIIQKEKERRHQENVSIKKQCLMMLQQIMEKK